jgi:hypothetical protein
MREVHELASTLAAAADDLRRAGCARHDSVAIVAGNKALAAALDVLDPDNDRGDVSYRKRVSA